MTDYPLSSLLRGLRPPRVVAAASFARMAVSTIVIPPGVYCDTNSGVCLDIGAVATSTATPTRTPTPTPTYTPPATVTPTATSTGVSTY